jgi:hypothetical protein
LGNLEDSVSLVQDVVLGNNLVDSAELHIQDTEGLQVEEDLELRYRVAMARHSLSQAPALPSRRVWCF